jgi:serine/threonine protein phosphatase PrpC
MERFGEFSTETAPEKEKILIETASIVKANPNHPDYTADKAVAKAVNKYSGLIAALDGVGSGGPDSAKAAEILQQELVKIEINNPPTINEGINYLKTTILRASEKIKRLQEEIRDPNVDTTVSAGMVCLSPNQEKYFLVTVNVGDSRVYRYNLNNQSLQQLTRDHSFVQELVDKGIIPPEKAFYHPKRNIITRSVGSIENAEEIDVNVTEIQDGDIFFAVSDGVTDNIKPESLPFAIKSEIENAYDSKGKINLKKFITGISQRAINIQTETQAPHAKPNDICIAALRVEPKYNRKI